MLFEFHDISFGMFFRLISAAFSIFIFFFITKRYLTPWIRNEQLKEDLCFYLPLVRNVVWILFFIDLVYEISLINLLLSLSIFGVIIALLWQLVRDFVQGIIFGFQKGDIVGQRLKIDNYSGIVSAQTTTKLHLEIENGEIIQFPYSKVNTHLVSKPTVARHLKSCSFSVVLSEKVNIDAAKEKLISHLLSMPWVISTMKIKVEVVDERNTNIELKVIVYTSSEKYISRIKQEIAELLFN
tara:strand:- start:295 stop:1014 length:720 start_codon:yes stop_codon:yes gene_type:complete